MQPNNNIKDNSNISNNKRVVVITGYSKGIGKSIAEDFAKAGYCVLINSLDEQELKDAVDQISNAIDDRNRVGFVTGDISHQHFSESLMEEAVKRFGGIDILINNGKITSGPANVGDSSIRSETNLQQTPYSVMEEYELANPKTKGIYFCVKAAVKRMLSENNKKNGYSIINISSCQGCLTQSAVNSYTERKFGVDPYVDSIANIETLTKTVALELADKGIRVNGIIPGFVYNDINKEIDEDEQKRNDKKEGIPIKRIAKPQEISKVALFLASEDASYVTGAMIPVDGGLALSRPNYFVEVI
jgi:NAD(P)-dependent dehydrogenase (short-subunit alcohol dehydrogenase family)